MFMTVCSLTVHAAAGVTVAWHDTGRETNTRGIASSNPALENNGRLVADTPSNSQTPTHLHSSAPPDYNTINAQNMYHPSAPSGYSSATNPDHNNSLTPQNASGTGSSDDNYSTLTTGGEFNNIAMQESQRDATNEDNTFLMDRLTEHQPIFATVDDAGNRESRGLGPDSSTMSSNTDRPPPLTPPPSYEEALQYEIWLH